MTSSVIILIILILTSLSFGSSNMLLLNVIDNAQGAFKRAINFVLGMAIAPLCLNKKCINIWKTIIFFGALFSFQIALRSYLNFYLFCNWCLTPILLIVFCSLLSKVKGKAYIYGFISWLGVVSLESYITNGATQGIAKYIASKFPNSDLFYGHYFEYAIVVVLGLGCAYIFHNWSVKILDIIKPEKRTNYTIKA